jgi:fructose-specific component phosphotransferase system IIB-like protein
LKLKLLAENKDREIHPTVSDILFATEHPEQFLPNAFIQAACYRATTTRLSPQFHPCIFKSL